jgi:hypothetical protein
LLVLLIAGLGIVFNPEPLAVGVTTTGVSTDGRIVFNPEPLAVGVTTTGVSMGVADLNLFNILRG